MEAAGCRAKPTPSEALRATPTPPLHLIPRAADTQGYAWDEASLESLGSRPRVEELTSVIWQRARTAGPR